MSYLDVQFSTRTDAEFAAQQLVDAGIEAWVSAGDGGGAIPAMQSATGVRLEVSEGDLEEAERVLQANGLLESSSRAPLSRGERVQGWVLGGLLIVIVGWMCWTAVNDMLNGAVPVDRDEIPAHGRDPF